MKFRVNIKSYNWTTHFLYQMLQWETERLVFRAVVPLVFGSGTVTHFQKEVRSCHNSPRPVLLCGLNFCLGHTGWAAASESDVLIWGTFP